jgi:ornithine decarboxylase
MHPIKNFNVISIAYRDYGVRRFVLDSPEELEKIMNATNFATDLTLIVRFSVSNFGSSLPLTGKFGTSGEAAISLVQSTREVAHNLGISFHVGSQSLKPVSYHMALAGIAAVIVAADVEVDIVDVGGGFPSVYDMETPPPLNEYLSSITSAVKSIKCFESVSLWCEPGRSLSAEGEGLLTRIEGRKKGSIYLNDGSFGALYDSVHERWNYPCRVIKSTGYAYPVMPTARENDEIIEQFYETESNGAIKLVPYIIYGPTCDSADRFPEPLMLPEDLEEGDYLEWGNIGAYGRSMVTSFNGFGFYETITVQDTPWPTLFNQRSTTCEKSEVESFSWDQTGPVPLSSSYSSEDETIMLELSCCHSCSSSSLCILNDDSHSSGTQSPSNSNEYQQSYLSQSPVSMLLCDSENLY